MFQLNLGSHQPQPQSQYGYTAQPGRTVYGYRSMIDHAREREQSAERLAGQSRNRFASAIYGFNPMEYMQDTAGSLFSGLSEQFGREEATRRASMNRAGMLRSGIGNTDAMNSFNERLARALAGLSMQGGQMEMSRMGMMGDLYGADQGQANRFFDAATGLNQSRIAHNAAQSAARDANQSAMIGSLIGAGGTIAGGLLGGPFGAALLGGAASGAVNASRR